MCWRPPCDLLLDVAQPPIAIAASAGPRAILGTPRKLEKRRMAQAVADDRRSRTWPATRSSWFLWRTGSALAGSVPPDRLFDCIVRRDARGSSLAIEAQPSPISKNLHRRAQQKARRDRLVACCVSSVALPLSVREASSPDRRADTVAEPSAVILMGCVHLLSLGDLPAIEVEHEKSKGRRQIAVSSVRIDRGD